MVRITPNTINKREAIFIRYKLNDEVVIYGSAAK